MGRRQDGSGVGWMDGGWHRKGMMSDGGGRVRRTLARADGAVIDDGTRRLEAWTFMGQAGSRDGKRWRTRCFLWSAIAVQ